jgi:hypothetical protein
MMANKKWDIVHRGKPYTFELNKLRVSADHRAELARVLKEAKQAAGYAAKSVDVELADRVIGLLGNGAEISNEAFAELGEIADGVTEAMSAQGEDEVATDNTNTKDLELMQAIANIAGSAEGRAALNKARAGAPLTPQERETVDRHNLLLTQHNEIADKERSGTGGGWMPTTRPHALAPELYALEKIKDPRERIHAIRSLKSQWRDDPKSAYNDASHGDHKNAIAWMSRLYQAEEALGPQPEDPE